MAILLALLLALALAEAIDAADDVVASESGETVVEIDALALSEEAPDVSDGGGETPEEPLSNGAVANAAEESADVEIDETNFPAEDFRNYVLAHFDKNGDGKLSAKEANAVKSIVLRTADQMMAGEGEMNCSSLKGVERFPNLKKLVASGCDINTLNVTKNTKLVTLECCENNLKKLNVTKNKQLVTLECWGNNLSSLDVTKNTKLVTLHCWGNGLKKLNVTKNAKLKNLRCNNNHLSALDVTKNKQLVNLNARGNQLKSINTKNNAKLEMLQVYDNRLTKLDVSKNKKLKYLYTFGNNIKSIDIKNCPKLRGYLKNGSETDGSFMAWFEKNGDDVWGMAVSLNTKLLSGKKVLYQP